MDGLCVLEADSQDSFDASLDDEVVVGRESYICKQSHTSSLLDTQGGMRTGFARVLFV